MIDLLDEAQEELINSIKAINWDELTERFYTHECYDGIKQNISLESGDGVINYSFGEFVLHFLRDKNKVLYWLDEFLFRAEKLVNREVQILRQFGILVPIETSLRENLDSQKEKVPFQFREKEYKELRLTILEKFDNRFDSVKYFERLKLSIINESQKQDFKVFRWKGSQADLFRYIKLAIELNLIEDDKLEISDFIKKHVLCRNLTSKEYQPIVPSELKSTFYSSTRNILDEKFIKKLKKLALITLVI